MTFRDAQIAVVFPGQGSQRVGMGRSFYNAWPETNESFDKLAQGTPFDLHTLCLGEDQQRVRRTEYIQPAVFATSLAAYRGVCTRLDGEPAVVAGHSLGHVTAVAASGAIAPTDCLDFVCQRGRLMASVRGDTSAGVMVAVMGADAELVSSVCDAHAHVDVAAYNSPRETVISGKRSAIETAQTMITNRSNARFRRLEVDAAFHSNQMQPVTAPIRALLDETHLDVSSIPIISDVSGHVYTQPDRVRAELTAQITAPIDWQAVTDRMLERGITRVVEVPPAGTLSRLIERITDQIDVIALETPEDVAAAI